MTFKLDLEHSSWNNIHVPDSAWQRPSPNEVYSARACRLRLLVIPNLACRRDQRGQKSVAGGLAWPGRARRRRPGVMQGLSQVELRLTGGTVTAQGAAGLGLARASVSCQSRSGSVGRVIIILLTVSGSEIRHAMSRSRCQ